MLSQSSLHAVILQTFKIGEEPKLQIIGLVSNFSQAKQLALYHSTQSLKTYSKMFANVRVLTISDQQPYYAIGVYNYTTRNFDRTLEKVQIAPIHPHHVMI